MARPATWAASTPVLRRLRSVGVNSPRVRRQSARMLGARGSDPPLRSRCEPRGEGPSPRECYEKVCAVFRDYLLFTGLPMPVTLCDTVLDVLASLDRLLDKDVPVLVAEAAVARIIYVMPVPLSNAESLRVTQALWGFRRPGPAFSDAPLSQRLMCALAQIFLAQGLVLLAGMLVLMFYTHLRPGDPRLAKRWALRAPVMLEGPLSHWALVLSPHVGLPTWGSMDDTIILYLPAELPLLVSFHFGSLLPPAELFPMSPATSFALFMAACDLQGVPRRACMYLMRHVGAAGVLPDFGRQRRRMVVRRRWSLELTLRRPEKLALSLRLQGFLAPVRLSRVLDSWEHVVAMIFQRVVPGLPCLRNPVVMPMTRPPPGATRAGAGSTRLGAVTPTPPSSSSSWPEAGAWHTRLRGMVPGVSASSSPMMTVRM
jgi:hypothetical protein